MSDVQSTAPTTIPLTVAEAKLQLNVTSTADDALIESLIRSATLLLENRTNRCFITQTRQLKMRTFLDQRYVRDREIIPPRSPLKSVSTVSFLDSDGTTTTLPSSDYRVSTGDMPGRISEEYSATWPPTRNVANDVTVTYVAGHSTVTTGVPQHVKHALRMVVGHWYRNREAVVTGTISKEVEFGVDALLEGERVERYA